ncbi:unnamed protein product [Hymenolepis diminuta]|uniref:Uncharacterized protein n=1 Tax=Hymenolepis diminuta TaxID=6216 RepID=A0A564Z1C5_HYMDI|nr:unnamed protein product [Hymenolepis diminuta]
MESSIPKAVPARFTSEPTVRKQRSVMKSCLFIHQTNQKCRLKGQKEGCSPLASFSMFEQSTMIKSPKCPDISLSHYPPYLNGLDEELVDKVKRQLLISQREETMEEIPNSLQSRYQMTPHVGV